MEGEGSGDGREEGIAGEFAVDEGEEEFGASREEGLIELCAADEVDGAVVGRLEGNFGRGRECADC